MWNFPKADHELKVRLVGTKRCCEEALCDCARSLNTVTFEITCSTCDYKRTVVDTGFDTRYNDVSLTAEQIEHRFDVLFSRKESAGGKWS